MNASAIFELLLESLSAKLELQDSDGGVPSIEAEVSIVCDSFRESDSLRVGISRRWNAYKRGQDSYGFLPLEFLPLVASVGWNETSKAATVRLAKPRLRAGKEYTLVSPSPAST